MKKFWKEDVDKKVHKIMKNIEKLRKVLKVSFFLIIVTIGLIFTFPKELKPNEWKLYIVDSYLVTTVGLTIGGALIGIFFGMFLAFLKFPPCRSYMLSQIFFLFSFFSSKFSPKR